MQRQRPRRGGAAGSVFYAAVDGQDHGSVAEIPFRQLTQSRVGGSGVVASEHHHSPRLGEFVPTMVGVPFDSDQSGMAAFDEGVAAKLHGDGGADLLAAADVASRSVGGAAGWQWRDAARAGAALVEDADQKKGVGGGADTAVGAVAVVVGAVDIEQDTGGAMVVPVVVHASSLHLF